MSAAVSRPWKNLFGVAAAVVLAGLGAATPVQARGLVADEFTMLPVTGCALNDTGCAAVSLGTHSIYIYADGIISIDSLLGAAAVSTALPGAGIDYIAPALADYSGVGITISDVDYLNPSSSNDETLRINWVFKDPSQTFDTAFGIDLGVTSGGDLYGFARYGYFSDEGVGSTPLGCTTCGGGFLPDEFVGTYLLPGTLIGSSYAADVVTFDDPLPVPGASATLAPEPGTWSMMVFGLGAMGAAIRFSRRRGAPARARA